MRVMLGGVRSADVFLASYPRSGSNLVRFIISYIIILKEQDREIALFSEAREIFPNLNEVSARRLRKKSGRRFIKTHLYFPTSAMKNIIYVYRDGRDAYASYYRWMRQKELISPDMSFHEFLKIQISADGSWGNHISAWMLPNLDVRFLAIKYEDLISDKCSSIRSIASFLDFELSEQEMQRLADVSSFESMSSMENKSDVVLRVGSQGASTVTFDEESVSLFKGREGEVLQKAGYQVNVDTPG
jgi:hypothetical protein